MKNEINKLALGLQDEMVKLRRDFHQHAESAWTEYRTASIVAKHLEDLGLEVLYGTDVIEASAMMDVPPATELSKHMERAKAQGAHSKYLAKMEGGKTGVVGILKTGRPGPVVALRFDMDANEMDETTLDTHRPNKEGFASVNPGAMHACGHDGHTAVGMGVAKLLTQIKDQLTGTIKICFQPAEEGVRGALSMVQKGLFDDVDYVLAAHLGIGVGTGAVCCSWKGLLATSKLDAVYTGVPAHAGARPEDGKSALLAAAGAAMSMQGIYRHSAGNSRINIGLLQAGTGRNVVPANALMKLETRGVTSEIDEFVKSEAIRMLNASAKMYDVQVEIKEMGGAKAAESDPELVDLAIETAKELGIFEKIIHDADMPGSEDYSFMMERVQSRGGKALFMLVGTDCASGPHTNTYDIDETSFSHAVALFSMLICNLGRKK